MPGADSVLMSRMAASRASAVESCGWNYWYGEGRRLFAEFVTAKRLVSKNGHSLVEPPYRVFFYTVSVPHVSSSANDSFKSLPAAAHVALTIHTFRMVQPEVAVLFGKRWEFTSVNVTFSAWVERMLYSHRSLVYTAFNRRQKRC